ncbi:recombinase-like zinc beta ribbon protein [Ruminiclostridium sufflavum DSM 19573]|uniref:Recombinase-like zinc beta ribbon protein n=1 Tax=Ruminiclostridium sufflavum DSM 19573 TaxID=1121337 RepID=A0A318XK73_9FIRM|nr:recombinase family protein [Ruminiclostridium sufflavum]PYG84926.1 recombinase-like zinc beta ribbon protein [Ruminiclostridium sufflavum DSM 19573]
MMQRHMPLGYKMVNGNIEIQEEQAEIIKRIFKDYINGKSMIAIAKELTVMNVLNANKKPNWNHGSVGKILQNVKYQGDTLYPKLIEKDIFTKAQRRRTVKEAELGRTQQIYAMRNQTVFSGKIRCGECGEPYRKYIEHAGKPSEKIKWKCKKYIFQNSVCCKNQFYTDSQLKTIFIAATNELIKKKWLLENVPKKGSLKMTLELRQTENRIKELDQEEQYSSPELAELLFKRAELYYIGSKIDDHKSNTEKIKEALADIEKITEFNEELFEAIIKQITVYKESEVEVEYINGTIINVENSRKDEAHDSYEKNGSNNTTSNKIRQACKSRAEKA